MKIAELGEFGLIDRIRQALPAPGRDVIAGIGDDVAVLRASGERVWLATCDVQVEGAHFVRDDIAPRDLGHKALAINLSDIAATGGRPRFALVSLGLPDNLDVEFVDELYAGLRQEAEAYGTEIVGGNISSSKYGLFVDITLLGEADAKDVVLRSGAHVGDQILVTGTLGDAAAGVELMLANRSGAPRSAGTYAAIARARYHRPTARVREGRIVGASRAATAMLDISDGLAGDLAHICDQSRVGARIFAERLPVAEANRALARQAGSERSSAANVDETTAVLAEWRLALFGGEDYELLFTVPTSRAESLAREIESQTGTSVSVIGEIAAEADGRMLVLPSGSAVPLRAGGWDHLKKE